MPGLRNPARHPGGLAHEAAAQLGLSPGIPVLVGAGDYPMALLGSGANRPGLGSDVTGTSTIITLLPRSSGAGSGGVECDRGKWHLGQLHPA